MRQTAKYILRLLCTLVAGPVILLYRCQCRCCPADRCFPGWTQLFSLIPGHMGVHLRQAFLRHTAGRCELDVSVGFGTIFSHPGVRLGRTAYIGNYCSIGDVTIEDDVLIASHVSIMNGSRQHGTDKLDRPIREQPGVLLPVTIGQNSWIGERATIAASVGRHCIVGAGTLVLTPLPDYAVAVGVPARIIRDRRDGRHGTASAESAEASLRQAEAAVAELLS
jgi:virginiamycin A acetyltransferase